MKIEAIYNSASLKNPWRMMQLMQALNLSTQTTFNPRNQVIEF
jgi:hypothetical protein